MSSAAPPTAEHAGARFIPLQVLTYTGAVPRPHAACTDPTPDQQIKAAFKEREEQLKQKEASIEQTANARSAPTGEQHAAPANNSSAMQRLMEGASEALEGLRGMANQFSISVEKATSEVSAKAHNQARALDQQQGYDRFATYFGDDLVKGQGEVLLADYGCTAMHGGNKVEGHLFITRNYLCFVADFTSRLSEAADALKEVVKDRASNAGAESGQTEPAKVAGIKQVIPLKNVASIIRSVVLPTVDNQPPYFLPVPADNVIATSLQVYEKEEKKIYQFLKFDSFAAKASSALSSVLKGTPLDRAYNYLDHAWREATKVPVDGVVYA